MPSVGKYKLEQLYDFDRDGLKDLIFGIHAGYSIQPRQIYIYNIGRDTVLRSPQSGVAMHNIKICDLNGDGFPEITGNTFGSGNIKPDMGIPYRDSSTWLMVYDHQLNFEYEPLEYPVYKFVVSARPVQYDNEKYIIACTRNEGIMEALMSSDAISRSLEKEVQFVRNYLDLLKFRFKGVFDYEINIASNVDLKTEVRKMIIQTFAENAVKHGMRGKENDGMIEIRICKKEDVLVITVEDNGPGFYNTGYINHQFTGKGLNLTQQISRLYKYLTKRNINILVEESSKKGTSVRIELHY